MGGFPPPLRAGLGWAQDAAAGLALWLCVPSDLPAQPNRYVGPARCYSCHIELAKPVWENRHKPSVHRLDQPAAAKFALALGYGGNTRGPRCAECHAPAVPGPPAGVSCETCHGPGRDYREPHQEPAFYTQADRKGLSDMYRKPAAIAGLCVDCHVTPEKALADAGHPAGRDFDAGRELQRMAHWPSSDVGLSRTRDVYDAAFYRQVSEAGRPLVKARAPGGGGAAGASARAVSSLATTAKTEPGAEGSRPKTAIASPPPVAVPSSADDPLFAPEVPLYEKPGPAPSAGDPLFAERVPPYERPAPVARAGIPAPGRPGPGKIAAPPSGPARPALVAPSSAAPASTAAGLLLRLLETRAQRLSIPPPAPPAEYAGPDSELLRIEDEIFALALEALRKPR